MVTRKTGLMFYNIYPNTVFWTNGHTIFHSPVGVLKLSVSHLQNNKGNFFNEWVVCAHMFSGPLKRDFKWLGDYSQENKLPPVLLWSVSSSHWADLCCQVLCSWLPIKESSVAADGKCVLFICPPRPCKIGLNQCSKHPTHNNPWAQEWRKACGCQENFLSHPIKWRLNVWLK